MSATGTFARRTGAMVRPGDRRELRVRVGKSPALAMVRPELAEVGTAVEMDILGTVHRATVIPVSPYDPENERLRG